jgi:hypothetical protein
VLHYFTIKFHFSFFASFCLFLLHFIDFRFKAKQSEAKFKSIFSLFSLFFALNFSFHLDLVIFASKRNKAKRNSSLFFRFFSFFSLHICFASIFSLNFRLFYLCFRFRFLVFHIEVNHVKSGFFSLPSEMKFSLQFLISLLKQK